MGHLDCALGPRCVTVLAPDFPLFFGFKRESWRLEAIWLSKFASIAFVDSTYRETA